MIWGRIGNGLDALHVIDFGNARFLPPHLTVWGYPPHKVPNAQILDKGVYMLLLYDFEMSVMWKEMLKPPRSCEPNGVFQVGFNVMRT